MRPGVVVGAVSLFGVGCMLVVDTSGLSGPDDVDGGASGSSSGVSSGESSSGTSGASSGTSGASSGTSGASSGTSGSDASTSSSGIVGPVSVGLSTGARINCAGGSFNCTPPGQACCVIFANMIDDCVDPATGAADCTNKHSDPTAIVACDDESDCPTGQICCAGLGGSGHPVLASACATACKPGEFGMCRMGGHPCPSGLSCQHIPALDTFNSGYGYRVCK